MIYETFYYVIKMRYFVISAERSIASNVENSEKNEFIILLRDKNDIES